MNLWRWLRQSDTVDHLTVALEESIRQHSEAVRTATWLRSDLDRERELRISAETLAVERRAEVERLISELSSVREELSRLVADRMKSLDALNVSLMTERVEEKPPDMAQYKKTMESLGANAVRQMRQIHRQADAAVLTKLHPHFAKAAGAVMNETMAPPED
jgi:hypothetical protein